MFRRGESVVICKLGDACYGRSGTVSAIHASEVVVGITGKGLRNYKPEDISGIPSTLRDEREASSEIWHVKIEMTSGEVSDITFERQPIITWNSGVVKIEGDDDIHIIPIDSITHIRMYI